MLVGHSNQSRRIEVEDRRVEACAHFFVLLNQRSQSSRVTVPNGALESLDRRSLSCNPLLDPLLELAPVCQTVFAGQHELRVGERERDLVGKLSPHAGDCLTIASTERVKQLLG